MPLLEQRSFMTTVPEPTNDTMTRGTPFEITLATWVSNNQVNGTELTSAVLSDYIGNWLEFLDGNVAGEWSRIREFDGTLTVTIDPVSNASPTPTRARMWIPPEPLLPATTSAGVATTIESSARTETATTYWADPDRLYAVCEGAGGAGTVARGEVQLITAFDGTNTFTTVAFAANPTVGDLFVMRQPIKPHGGEVSLGDLGYGFIERKFVKGTMDQDPGVQGPRSVSLEFALEVKGNNTAASGATVALPPTEARDLLFSAFSEDRDGASAATAGGGTTTVNMTTGTQERFAVGNMVLVSGQAAGITAITDGGVGDDVLTVAPALGAAPATGVTVLGGVNYEPQTSGFRSHTHEFYVGNSTREIIYGHHFTVSLEGLVNNEIPRWKFAGPADHHIRQDVAAPTWNPTTYPTFESKLPWPSRASRVVLGGTTLSTVIAATFNVGYVWEPQTSVNGAQGRNGHQMVNRKTTGTLRIWLDNMGHLEDFEQVRERELLIQVGSTATNCVALWCPAIQYSNVTIEKEGGGYVYNISYNVLSSSITSVSSFVICTF